MKRIPAFLVLASFALAPCEAVEVKKEGWLFPNPAAAEKKDIRPLDYTPRIPGAETLVKIYKRKKDGAVFDTMEIEGDIYACQFHILGENGAPPTVYAIVDTDGDGSFESKYSRGEKAEIPEWVILRYYKKHPELSDPGPTASHSPQGK